MFGFIINLVIGLVVSLASTLISSIFQQDNQKQKVAGVKGTIQKGGDHPLAFIMGFYGTAGHLKYAGTWGNVGETPNAHYSKVISVSDLPVRGLAGFFVNGKRVTLAAGETGSLGRAVLEYRVNGVDHLWVKFYDGTQVAPDPLMLDRFATDPDRPYTADMVGRGVAYFVATALVNRELFSGFPEYFAEINGIPLDDPRGDGAHDNPLVGIYTLMKGIRYGGVWVYGPQNITAANFVYANLEAQMDKCDVPIPLDGGGTQRRFRFGLEVSVDTEPQAIIGELLKSCQGRVAEIGGIYKFLVGEPDAPVVSVTDEDVVITHEQTYEPFPGLESLFNGITATYPEPAEAWESKEAPPRYRSDLEALDDGRRLPFSTDYKAVPYPVQVQLLMRAAIEETRRFRKTTKTMAPEFWEYEPLDAYSETSVRNGWTDKLFLITAMDDLPNGNQFVGGQENDPSDYDWSSDYQLPWDISPVVIARPAPQITTGFTAAPYVVTDGASNARRPAIEVFWDGGKQDVRDLVVEVRESWDGKKVIASATLDYDIEDASPSAVISNPSILPNETYEVRGLYLPFSGRVTRWSNQDAAGVDGPWLSVTTPNVKLGPLDVVYGDLDLNEIGEQAKGMLEWIGGNLRNLIDQAQAQATLTGDQELANAMQFDEMRRSLSTVAGNLSASFEETITTAIIPMNGQLVAVADALTQLSAADGDAVNTARWRMTATTGPGGSSVLGFEARFDPGNTDDFRTAGMFIITPNDPEDPTTIMFDAERFVLGDLTSGTSVNPLVYDGGIWRVNDLLVGSASIQDAAIVSAKIGTAAITTAKIADANITTAKIDNLAVTTGKIANLAVNTLQIAGNAVTVPAYAATSGDTTITPAILSVSDFYIDPYFTTVQTVAITVTGGDIFIDCSLSTRPSGAGDYCFIGGRLLRNGTEIRRWTFISSGLGNPYSAYAGAPPVNQPQAVPVYDPGLSAGTYTYTLQVAAGRWISGDNIIVSNRQLRAFNRLK